MIDSGRFIAPQRDFSRWLVEHRAGVSATTVAKAATPSGYRALFDGSDEQHDNPFMAWGREREPVIGRAMQGHGVLPSDWLIAGEDPLHRATPDGLSLDHERIAEVKTTGDPWDGAEGNLAVIPIQYRRQVQWQLHVTGAEQCLFLWELRAVGEHGFFTPWLEPRWLWIGRDEKMIAALVEVADRLIGDGYGRV